MTKEEKTYLLKIIKDTNRTIEKIKQGKYQPDFLTKAEREKFLQGINEVLEPLAYFLGQEPESIDF